MLERASVADARPGRHFISSSVTANMGCHTEWVCSSRFSTSSVQCQGCCSHRSSWTRRAHPVQEPPANAKKLLHCEVVTRTRHCEASGGKSGWGSSVRAPFRRRVKFFVLCPGVTMSVGRRRIVMQVGVVTGCCLKRGGKTGVQLRFQSRSWLILAGSRMRQFGPQSTPNLQLHAYGTVVC